MEEEEEATELNVVVDQVPTEEELKIVDQGAGGGRGADCDC